jgi:hypothetical protein
VTVRRLAGLAAFAAVALVVGSGCVGRSKAAVESRPSRYCGPDTRAALVVVDQACQEVSELTREGISETEVTSAVRHWVARWTDVYSDLRLASPKDYWNIGVDDHFMALERDEYGLACGNTAWILMQVYEALGLESYLYNFGDDSGSGISHVLTLVRADGRVIVQDAYTNYTLTDMSGEPFDIHDVLRLVGSGRGDEVLVNTEPTTKQVLLPVDNGRSLNEVALTARAWVSPRGLNPNECSLLPNSAARCIAKDVDASNIKYWSRWADLEKFVQGHGFEPELTSLMLFPLGVSSTNDGWTPVDDTRKTPTNGLMTSMLDAMGDRP